MIVNINDTVKVKLNDRGFEIHKNMWEPFYNTIKTTYVPPFKDKDGYSTFQLWSLMETYGPHISLGSLAPFDTDIEILS
jgi:hypothetical protein